jgi:hypothetical protein
MYTSSNHFSHQTNKFHSREPRNVRLFPGVRIRTVGCHCVSRVCQAILAHLHTTALDCLVEQSLCPLSSLRSWPRMNGRSSLPSCRSDLASRFPALGRPRPPQSCQLDRAQDLGDRHRKILSTLSAPLSCTKTLRRRLSHRLWYLSSPVVTIETSCATLPSRQPIAKSS